MRHFGHQTVRQSGREGSRGHCRRKPKDFFQETGENILKKQNKKVKTVSADVSRVHAVTFSPSSPCLISLSAQRFREVSHHFAINAQATTGSRRKIA